MSRAASGAERIESWLGPAGAAYAVIKPMVDFMANPLDEVTGDPDQLRAKAVAWRDAADKLDEFARSEQVARADLLSYWEGDAATAFNTAMTEANRSLTEISDHFEVTAQLLEGSADGAQQAQDLVEQIIKELIAWLIITIIVALASAYITAGASLAAGTAAGWAQSAAAVARIGGVARRLAMLLRKVSEFLAKMSKFAKDYGMLKIHKVGPQNWMTARFATSNGYQLIATNWVIKKTIVQPTLGPTVDKVTGADEAWDLPQLL